MKDNIVNVDRAALEELIKVLEDYYNSIEGATKKAIKDIRSNENAWSDDDFHTLLKGIESFEKEVEILGKANNEIIERTRKKIEAIDQRPR